MKISDIREQFPQYNDLSDTALADALHSKYYPDLPKEDVYKQLGLETSKKGLGAAFERGLESYLSPSLTALQGPSTESALAGVERARHLEETNPSQTSLEKVKEAFKKGVLPGIGETVREIPYAFAEQAPNLVSMGAGARLGAMAGAPFGGVGALGGAGLGALAGQFVSSYLPQAGGNIEEQAQAQKARGEPVNINALKAYGTAVPMAAADVGLMHYIGGRGLMGKMLGVPEELMAKKSAVEVEKLAQEKLVPSLLKGTAKGLAAEVPTEIFQDVLQRAQAGEDLTSPEAFQGYGETAFQMGLLSPLGALGRLSEKSEARGQLETKKAEEQKKQQIQAIKDQQTADAQEEQRKQDPAYMQTFVQNYEALQDRYKDLQKQTKKPDMKTAVPADIEQYNQNREQLAEMRKKLTADSQEYLQLRPAYNRIRAQQQAQAQQAEDQRYQQMETETAQNQPTADTAYYQSPQGTLPGIQPAIDPTTGEPVAQAPEKVDTRALYDRLQILQRAKDAHQQQESEIAASGDMKALGEFFKQKDTVDKAYKDTAKQLKEAGGYEPAPKHPAVVAQAAYNKAAAELQEKSKAGTFGYDPEVARKLYAKVEAAQNNLDSVIAEHGPAPRGHEQEGFDFGPESKFPELTQESIPDFVKRRNDALVAERKKQAELYEQKIRPEIQGIQRIASRRDEGPTIFGQLPQMEEAPKKGFGSAAMGQMQQNLEGIEPGTDLIHTAEETQARNAEKSPTEPYRGLYASPTEEPEFTRERKEEMRADLERRLASVMSRYEMPQGTYDMLRRAENALAVPNPDTDFMRTLDEQLKEIESGREGMPRKGAALPTEDLRAFPLGETAVYKRFSKEAGEAGRPILRGASAKPAPLSRQAELEEHLRTSEAARGEGPIKEKQLPLFPEEEEKLGTVRANPAQFQRFLNSDKVKKLRLALDKDLNELQKLDVIDQLKTRADALAKEVNAMESVNLEYGQAQRTLRHQRDVGKQRYDVNQLRQAMFSGIIRRMGLQNKLDELKKAKNELDAEARANHIGGWDGFDPDLHANLEHMHEEYQRAVNEMAEMQGALSTLEGRLKVEEAKIKIAKLNPLTTPKDTLAAAKEELNAARFDLGEAQKTANAELVANKAEEGKQRRADEAVAKAKADKIRDDIAKERQERLEAAYNPATRGVEYPAILDAQRMAKELPAQERQPTTNAEEQAIRGNPMKVLGGYKSDVTKLEKKIQQSQTKSKNARLEGLSELRNNADALNKQYKESATSAERAELLPKLEAAETAYDEEVNKLVDQPITWIGMAKDIRDLAVAINRADRLEARIESGDVEIQGVLPAKQRKAPRKSIKRAEKTVNGIKDKIAIEKDEAKKVKLEERLANAEKFLTTAKAEEAQRNTQAAKAAQETAGAAKTTEPALTKSEVKKATKQGNTVYTSKGVGEEIQTKIAKEVKSKEIVENENKYKALKAKKPSTLNAMEKAFIQMYEYKYGGKSSGLADKILAEDKKKNDNTSEPISKPIPVKTLLTFRKNAPALKPASKPLQRLITPEIAKSLTKEDFEKLAETRYGTSITHDHPVNGMTFEEAALHGAKKTTSPMVKQLFNALAEVFKHAPVLDGSGRVYTVNDPIETNKERALGVYSTSLDAVYLHAEPNGSKSFNKVLLHELTHAATVRAMYLKPELMKQMDDLRTKAIAWLQTPEGKKYFRNHSMGLGKTRESIYGLRNAKEFVAEVFANREFQKLLSDIPSDKPRKSIFTRLVEALSKFFEMPAKAAQSLFAEAISLSEDVMNVTREQIYEGKAGPLAFAPEEDISPFIAPKYNTEAFARVGNIADKFIAKEKTFFDKVKANATGLAAETQLVDRFAGFERLSKTMDELKGHQMMFYLRMYDQRMNFVAQSVANGALGIAEKTRADGRKEYLIESKPGPSLKSTVEILKEASPLVGNGEAVNRLFTLYMSAIRAIDKGFEALHFGNNLTEAELKQAKATIDATPELKDIFDRARHEYNTYNRNQLEFAAQAGAISKDVVARLLKENDYIPWYRQRNGVAELVIGSETPIRVGSIAEQPYLQELVGGDTPILDFVTSSVQNTNMIADMGLRNLATKNAVFELVDMDLAHISKKKLAGADVVKFKVDGEDRYAIIDTDKVGIPADILVKGMEGIPAQMPFAFRVMGIPAKLLRKVVTASPLYAAKQLFRDSLAATILSGADFTPVMGSLKEINSATKATLEQRGITGGQIFTGTNEDLSKILKDIVNNKPGWLNSLSKWEAMSMEADATTRRAQYNSYIQQGLSEMEATLMSLESMNFNKRGASPSVHIINSLIPFFNAQIQSLNVLYKALTGKLPFNEKLKIQEKLLVRGAMLAAGTLAYTMMMQDDDAYKNATPDQKYNNWFVRVPGVDEPVRLPIPFEIGYIFKALPEALYNTMVNKHGKEEAVEAFSGIMKNLIPGGSSYGIPQALKPAIEAGLGKSFYTGRDILTKTEQNLLPEDQFRANTTEAAKAFGKATGTSPIIMEELVRGYTGTLGLAFLQAVSMGVPKGDTPEQTAGRLSELPVVGGAFQPNDAGGIISSVYKRMDDIKKVANTVDERLSKGQKAEALDLIHRTGNAYAASEVADYYTSTMKDLTSYENAIRASNMTGEQKREKLDYIRQMKIKFANSVRNATDKIALQ